jgi:hypothetical protein
MDESRFDPDSVRPMDELSPALRWAVEQVLREPMPEDLAERSLGAARRLQEPRPEPPRPSSRGRQAMTWRVLAVAASIGLVAVLVWWRWAGAPGPEVGNHSPTPPGRSQEPLEPQPIPPTPEPTPLERPPTLWAYRQAAGRSAEALDALLDRDARWVLRPEPQSFQAGAIPRFGPLMF